MAPKPKEDYKTFESILTAIEDRMKTIAHEAIAEELRWATEALTQLIPTEANIDARVHTILAKHLNCPSPPKSQPGANWEVDDDYALMHAHHHFCREYSKKVNRSQSAIAARLNVLRNRGYI